MVHLTLYSGVSKQADADHFDQIIQLINLFNEMKICAIGVLSYIINLTFLRK